MISIRIHLSHNANKALVKGITIGVITVIAYIVILVITTPSLAASSAKLTTLGKLLVTSNDLSAVQ
jgi:hypothetical protein